MQDLKKNWCFGSGSVSKRQGSETLKKNHGDICCTSDDESNSWIRNYMEAVIIQEKQRAFSKISNKKEIILINRVVDPDPH
jgi:hypothetical protein